jgi:adenine phosphoribosyltransferase
MLKESFEGARVIRRGGYRYFVHPVTDGVPELKPALLREIIEEIKCIADLNVDKIVAIEAMGIQIGTALSLDTDIPMVIVRKKSYGLPGEIEISQQTGYSKGTLYLNGVRHGDQVIVVDDVISTGGTLLATLHALKIAGASIVNTVAVIERGDGAQRLRNEGYNVKTIIKVDVNDQVKVVSSHKGSS